METATDPHRLRPKPRPATLLTTYDKNPGPRNDTMEHNEQKPKLSKARSWSASNRHQAEEPRQTRTTAIKLIADYAEQPATEWRAVETGKIQGRSAKIAGWTRKTTSQRTRKAHAIGEGKEWEKNHAELESDIQIRNKKARELSERIGWRLSGETKTI